MEVNLTDIEKKYLLEFASKQYDGSKDNVGTCDPIHVVERRCDIITTSDYSDETKFVVNMDGDYSDYETFEEALKCLVECFCEDELDLETLKNCTDEEEVNNYLEECGYELYSIEEYAVKHYYEPVAYFLIRDEAERYMKYQKHNLGEGTRIYTRGLGYDNRGDMPIFRELLMKLGQQLLMQQGDRNG